MKKIIIGISLLILFLLPVSANEKKEVSFQKCTDGDTAHFLMDGNDVTVRFLAIDTPEYTKEKEPYGKEASEFTCNAIQKAERITLEFDDGATKSDKYGRLLAWIFVDGELLQKQLVEEGLAEVAYLYGDYAYTSELEEAQQIAKQRGLAIWSSKEPEESIPVYMYIVSGIGIVVILVLSFSNVKGKNKKIRAVKKLMKEVKKRG